MRNTMHSTQRDSARPAQRDSARPAQRDRRSAAARLTACLLAVAAATVSQPTSAQAASVSVERVWGQTRYETAVEVATDFLVGSPAGTPVKVIIAPGRDYRLAIAAVPLSKVHRAPILLTEQDKLPAAVRAFLAANSPAEVYVVGDQAVVGAAVFEELAGLASTAPRRIAGASVHETVAAIAGQVPTARIGEGCTDASKMALMGTSQSFADALALSPVAWKGTYPVLLTERDKLPDPAAAFLTGAGVSKVLLAGGPQAVAASTADQIAALGIEVVRIWGKTRYDTAVAIARHATGLDDGSSATGARGCLQTAQLSLASGRKFPDAMVGGALAGQRSSPVLLTDTALPSELAAWLAGIRPTGDASARLTVLGGTAAVSEQAAAAAEAALRSGTVTPSRPCGDLSDSSAGAPTDLVVAPIPGGLSVSWNAPATIADAAPASYVVQYRAAGTSDWASANAPETSHTLENLTGGVLHEVRVQAVGPGYGAWSASGFATPGVRNQAASGPVQCPERPAQQTAA